MVSNVFDFIVKNEPVGFFNHTSTFWSSFNSFSVLYLNSFHSIHPYLKFSLLHFQKFSRKGSIWPNTFSLFLSIPTTKPILFSFSLLLPIILTVCPYVLVNRFLYLFTIIIYCRYKYKLNKFLSISKNFTNLVAAFAKILFYIYSIRLALVFLHFCNTLHFVLFLPLFSFVLNHSLSASTLKLSIFSLHPGVCLSKLTTHFKYLKNFTCIHLILIYFTPCCHVFLLPYLPTISHGLSSKY